jgi:hypothetical protein
VSASFIPSSLQDLDGLLAASQLPVVGSAATTLYPTSVTVDQYGRVTAAAGRSFPLAIGDTIGSGGSALLKTVGGVLALAVANTDYAPVASPVHTGTLTVPTLVGGSSASGTLTLESTSHATKGTISALGSVLDILDAGRVIVRAAINPSIELRPGTGGTAATLGMYLSNGTLDAALLYASGNVYFDSYTGGSTINFRPGGLATLVLSSAAVTLSEAINLAFGTTTGTKLGTGATQKLGFWNAAPVVQPAKVADADGTLASATSRINAILAQLQTTGLQAAA